MSNLTDDSERRAGQLRAFGYLALAATAALVCIALPIGVGLFLGVLLAFTLQPTYGRLRSRRWRAGPAALVCTLASTTVVGGVVSGLVALFITRGVTLAYEVPALLGPGGAIRVVADRNMATLRPLHLDPAAISAKLAGDAVALGSRAAGFAAEAAEATLGGLLTLFFMALAAYYVLRHWTEMVARAETMLPFEPRHTHALLDHFRDVGRKVLRGTVVTGIVQGVLAALGYALAGVPEPALFGALTAAASLAPAVGTLLVWVPAGLGLVVTGHAGAGVFLLVWSTLVVVVVPDYVIRPRLVGHEESVPSVLMFMSLFGGVEVFGLFGLVLGPVIVTLALAVLRTYESALRADRGT